MAKLTKAQRAVLNVVNSLSVTSHGALHLERHDRSKAWDELLAAGLIGPITIHIITPAGRRALQQEEGR
jgi:hypothetical protein